ncbi:MAG: hypothetical protein AAFV53_11765 [Myxococcota bacterium]
MTVDPSDIRYLFETCDMLRQTSTRMRIELDRIERRIEILTDRLEHRDHRRVYEELVDWVTRARQVSSTIDLIRATAQIWNDEEDGTVETRALVRQAQSPLRNEMPRAAQMMIRLRVDYGLRRVNKPRGCRPELILPSGKRLVRRIGSAH